MGCRICFYVCVLLVFVHIAYGKNPGISIFLSADAIDDVVKSAAKINAKALETLLHEMFRFHNASGSFPTLPYKHVKLPLFWSLQNVEYHIIGVPTDAHARPIQDMMHLEFTEMWLRLRGDWALHTKHRVVHDSGRFNGTFCFTAALNGTIDKKNDIHVKDCQTSFCSRVQLDLSYGHVPGWLRNSLTRLIEKHITSDIMCNSMPIFHANRTEHVLLQDPDYLVDLSSVKVTNVSKDGVSLDVVGECFNVNTGPLGDSNPMEAPLIPAVHFNRKKMAQFATSSYPISTFLYAMYKSNILMRDIDTSELSVHGRVLFATKCRDVCIGSAIPQIGKQYPGPNVFVSVNMRSDGNIEVHVKDSHLEIAFSGYLNFHIGNHSLFTLHTTLRGEAVPVVAHKTVVIEGKVQNITWNSPNVTSSTVGPISMDVVNMLLKKFVKVVCEPLAKDTFGIGYDMGRFIKLRQDYEISRQTVKLVDIDVELSKGLILVSADFLLDISNIGNHAPSNDRSVIGSIYDK